jgi:hypothetical protein
MSAPKKSKTDAHQLQNQNTKKGQSSKPEAEAWNCEEMDAKQSRTSSRENSFDSTKIVVKCNCGFSNKLYIRGTGVPGLSWEKGTLMKCTKADEWVWETNKPFRHGEVKIVMNDDNAKWEQGPNHGVDAGKQITFAPKF